LRLLRDLLRQDPIGASAREPTRPRLAVCEGELTRLLEARLACLCALFDHGRRGPMDVGVRVAISVLQMLLHQLVVRPGVPTAQAEESLRRQRPSICLEPESL